MQHIAMDSPLYITRAKILLLNSCQNVFFKSRTLVCVYACTDSLLAQQSLGYGIDSIICWTSQKTESGAPHSSLAELHHATLWQSSEWYAWGYSTLHSGPSSHSLSVTQLPPAHGPAAKLAQGLAHPCHFLCCRPCRASELSWHFLLLTPQYCVQATTSTPDSPCFDLFSSPASAATSAAASAAATASAPAACASSRPATPAPAPAPTPAAAAGRAAPAGLSCLHDAALLIAAAAALEGRKPLALAAAALCACAPLPLAMPPPGSGASVIVVAVLYDQGSCLEKSQPGANVTEAERACRPHPY